MGSGLAKRSLGVLWQEGDVPWSRETAGRRCSASWGHGGAGSASIAGGQKGILHPRK